MQNSIRRVFILVWTVVKRYGIWAEVLLPGCGSGELSALEYKRYVEDPQNGFVQTCSVGDIPASVIQVDPKFLAIQHLRTNDPDPAEFRRVQASFAGYDYFQIKLGDAEGQSLEGWSTFFDYEFQGHLRLIQGGDTVPCGLYLPEPYMPMRNSKNILVGFRSSGNSDRNVELWIQPIVNMHVGNRLAFDLDRPKPPIDL